MTAVLTEQKRATERRPLAELLLLAGPTIIQMASYTTMQFADTWMLSRLGMTEPTAAGNGGLTAWSIIGFGAGVLICVNTMVSQHYGKKEYSACGRYLWQGIWFAMLFWLAIAPAVLFARHLFAWMGHEGRLVHLESTFFQITVAWTGVKLASVALGQFLLATNRPMMTLLAAVCAVAVNAGVNYLVIFGNWGFPRLGVAGAAWGTNIGVTVELIVLAAVAMRPAMRREFNSLDWRLRPEAMRVLLRIGLPSGFQLVGDIAAWNLFLTWVLGRFGTAAMAANTFMIRYLSVSFMPAFGISTAVTALVGRYIGAGQPEIARRRAHLGFFVAAAYMLACGTAYVVGRHRLIGLFTADPEVLRLGAILLIFAGIYQFFDAMFIIYNGALRGAGDTFVPAVTLVTLCWTIMVMGGYAVARWWPQWGLTGPWTIASVYGLILGVFMWLRFVRGKWEAIRLEREEPAAKVGFEVIANA
jgi:MATE family multidrug resistance protein